MDKPKKDKPFELTPEEEQRAFDNITKQLGNAIKLEQKDKLKNKKFDAFEDVD